jgi:hypothetical protein
MRGPYLFAVPDAQQLLRFTLAEYGWITREEGLRVRFGGVRFK